MPLLATDHSNCNVPYSFMDTETELQHSAFQRASSPANSMIDESPISPSAGLPNSGHQIKRSRIASEEAPLPQPEVSLGFEPSIEMHPARYAPYAEPMHGAEIPRLMNEKQLQEPTTINTGQQPLSSAAPTNTSPFAQRKIESLGLSPDTIQRNIAYSPDSLAGPNLGHVNHQPGQVSHPNATVEPEWRHGLYGVDTLCCTGLVCPCIVYGKTQYRLSRKAQKQDPTDLLGYESCNGSCGIMAAACGLQWIFITIQRARIRKLYQLKGSLGDDCLKALCCSCCVVMQDEREVRDREELFRRNAGPASGYAPTPLMSFAPPPR